MKFKQLIRYILPMAFLGITGGCTNELPGWQEPGRQDSTITLAKSPDVIAWSGNQVLGNTFGTRDMNLLSTYSVTNYDAGVIVSGFDTVPNGDPQDFKRWQGDSWWVRPHDIIEAEKNYVIDYLQKNPNGGYKTIDIYNYVIQVVGGAEHSYMGDIADHNGTWHTVDNATSQMNKCSINGYFSQYNNNSMNSEDPLMLSNVKATNATYHDSYGDNVWENHYAFYFITFPEDEEYIYMSGKTGLYLCYDYATYKSSEQWGVTADGIYNDWIIKLSPADGSDISVIYPENPEPGEPNQPGKEVTGIPTSEVEVNLSINDEGNQGYIDGLITKLSIHVRQAGDVEVFIPVPKEYYCDVDDMAIVQKHEEELMIHGGPTEITYNINGNTVTLTINFEDEGIRVTTDGITEEVFQYCVENFGDGINFEVYNYFNDSITREELKEYLNKSTIEFLKEVYPDFYINAFTDHNGKWDEDCTVSIVEEQKSEYNSRTTGEHLNSSPYNEIYTNNNYEGTPGEHGHEFLWGLSEE